MRKKDNVIERERVCDRESIRERVFICLRERECKRKSVFYDRIYLRHKKKCVRDGVEVWKRETECVREFYIFNIYLKISM